MCIVSTDNTGYITNIHSKTSISEADVLANVVSFYYMARSLWCMMSVFKLHKLHMPTLNAIFNVIVNCVLYPQQSSIIRPVSNMPA